MLVKLALAEGDSQRARDLWMRWVDDGVQAIAPTLIAYEFVSTVRQQIRRGNLTTASGELALQELLDLKLTLVDLADLHLDALRIANALDIASAYDAHYLALAAALECEFWTADARLHRSVSDRFPLIRLLGA